MNGDSCDARAGGVATDIEYLNANEPVVKEQLRKAAVRLARILDTAFGN
jgi:hypothetical protein